MFCPEMVPTILYGIVAIVTTTEVDEMLTVEGGFIVTLVDEVRLTMFL